MLLNINEEGFRYHDSRDLTGFVDGSANPKEDKRKGVALFESNDEFKNGSFVFTQMWSHNLKSFHKNKVEEQEKIIGRTKSDSIELYQINFELS